MPLRSKSRASRGIAGRGTVGEGTSGRPSTSSAAVGNKRNRSDTRSSAGSFATTSVLTKSDSSTMLSPQKADAEFDTPSSYLAKAREVAEGGFWGLVQGSSQMPAQEDTEDEASQERPTKRRKGMAEALLSTAVDAALFTGAVGCEPFWHLGDDVLC